MADSQTQSVEIGEANVPHAQGAFEVGRIHAEIGERAARGRQSASEITVFDSSGIAIQDLTAARLIRVEQQLMYIA